LPGNFAMPECIVIHDERMQELCKLLITLVDSDCFASELSVTEPTEQLGAGK